MKILGAWRYLDGLVSVAHEERSPLYEMALAMVNGRKELLRLREELDRDETLNPEEKTDAWMDAVGEFLCFPL